MPANLPKSSAVSAQQLVKVGLLPSQSGPARQRGAALLIILSVVLLAITAVVITRLSVNSMRIDRNEATMLALSAARDSLLGYALRQPVVGTLPCPDTDTTPDGLANYSGTACTSQIGRFPYRTLSSEEFKDGSNTPLWYAVAPAYSNISGAIVRNSSIAVHYTLDGELMAAVVIAPGAALPGQVRVPITVAGFLEGENANASVNTYARVNDESNNDQLIGLGIRHFWTTMETRVVQEAGQLARRYQLACGEYPWAATYGLGADTSVDLLQEGNFPLISALPTDWNTDCAVGIAPSAELQFHWRDQLYYSMCLTAQGNCIATQGDSVAAVAAVVIAPGIALVTQNRASISLSEFFELENANPSSPVTHMLERNFSPSFNDLVYPLSP